VTLGTKLSVSECIKIHANPLGGAVGDEMLACGREAQRKPNCVRVAWVLGWLMVLGMLGTHWIDGLVSVMRVTAPCIVKELFADSIVAFVTHVMQQRCAVSKSGERREKGAACSSVRTTGLQV
jgi:hypothetical protein